MVSLNGLGAQSRNSSTVPAFVAGSTTGTVLDTTADVANLGIVHQITADNAGNIYFAAIDQRTGRVAVLRRAPGDGRVTRKSALLDERSLAELGGALRTPIPWSQVQFLFTGHIGLTKDPSFTDNLLFILLEQSA